MSTPIIAATLLRRAARSLSSSCGAGEVIRSAAGLFIIDHPITIERRRFQRPGPPQSANGRWRPSLRRFASFALTRAAGVAVQTVTPAGVTSGVPEPPPGHDAPRLLRARLRGLSAVAKECCARPLKGARRCHARGPAIGQSIGLRERQDRAQRAQLCGRALTAAYPPWRAAARKSIDWPAPRAQGQRRRPPQVRLSLGGQDETSTRARSTENFKSG
jgi:hypothetical protein